MFLFPFSFSFLFLFSFFFFSSSSEQSFHFSFHCFFSFSLFLKKDKAQALGKPQEICDIPVKMVVQGFQEKSGQDKDGLGRFTVDNCEAVKSG